MSSLVVLAALGVAGMVAFGLTWSGLASKADVARQLPYLVSGGLGGLALLAFALGLLCIQARRWAEARRHANVERVVEAARELLRATRAAAGAPRP